MPGDSEGLFGHKYSHAIRDYISQSLGNPMIHIIEANRLLLIILINLIGMGRGSGDEFAITGGEDIHKILLIKWDHNFSIQKNYSDRF